MIPQVDRRRIASLALAAAATAAAFWLYAAQPRTHAPAVVPIQDGKTIDFSSGKPVIKDSSADKAKLDAAVKEIDEASKDVTFPATAPKKK